MENSKLLQRNSSSTRATSSIIPSMEMEELEHPEISTSTSLQIKLESDSTIDKYLAVDTRSEGLAVKDTSFLLEEDCNENENKVRKKASKRKKSKQSSSNSKSESRMRRKMSKAAKKSDDQAHQSKSPKSLGLNSSNTKENRLRIIPLALHPAYLVDKKDEMQEEEWLYGESDTKVEPVYHSRPEDNDGDLSGTGIVDDTGENDIADGEVTKSSSEAATDNQTEPIKEGTQGKGTIEADEGANDDASEEDDDDDDDDEDSDDDDDGPRVVIGDIKSATVPPGPGTFASKRPAGPPPDKKGKFSTEDFEATGTINGVPAQDFSLDSIEEKPWRKPGADLTDYFNYGFTEETWRAYCDRQKRLRYESGSTLPSVMDRERKHHPQVATHAAIPIIGSDKYSGPPPNVIFPKKFGMPDRSPKEPLRVMRNRDEHRENTIQVMTADRREYSRKAFDMPPPIAPPFDMSVPPPPFPPPDPYRGGPGPGPDFFSHPPPPHPHPPHPSHPPHQQYFHEEHGDYEDHQWMDSAWEANMKGPGPSAATTVVPLTKISNLPPPPGESDDLDKRTPPIKEEIP